jgi:hypothetical protein
MNDVVLKPYRLMEVFDCMARHLGVRYRREVVALADVPNLRDAGDEQTTAGEAVTGG